MQTSAIHPQANSSCAEARGWRVRRTEHRSAGRSCICGTGARLVSEASTLDGLRLLREANADCRIQQRGSPDPLDPACRIYLLSKRRNGLHLARDAQEMLQLHPGVSQLSTTPFSTRLSAAHLHSQHLSIALLNNQASTPSISSVSSVRRLYHASSPSVLSHSPRAAKRQWEPRRSRASRLPSLSPPVTFFADGAPLTSSLSVHQPFGPATYRRRSLIEDKISRVSAIL